MKILKTASLIVLAFFVFFMAQPLRADVQDSPEVQDAQEAQRIAEESLVCLCGCGSTIKTCPHTDCGFAIPARRDIESLSKQGKSAKEIIDMFVAKYGAEILVSPPKSGFNLVAYILPFVAVIIAVAAVFAIMKKWTSRGLQDEEATLSRGHDEKLSQIDDQIEKELEDLD